MLKLFLMKLPPCAVRQGMQGQDIPASRGGEPHSWSSKPWECSTNVQMWHLGTWFSREQGSAGLTVGPDYLKDLFQSKKMYDSTKPGQHLHIPTAPVPPGTWGHLSPAPLGVSTGTEHGVIAGAGQQTVLQHCWWPGALGSPLYPCWKGLCGTTRA